MEQSEPQDQDARFAISIRQPWMELILRGVKSIELRKWTTDYRGPLWLHSSMKVVDVPSLTFDTTLFVGGYVGYAVLQTIMEMDSRRWESWRAEHCDSGPYVPGYFGWILVDVVRFRDPLRAPGKLGLFKPAPEHLSILRSKCEELR